MQSWERIEPTVRTKIDYHDVIVKTFKLPDGNIATRTTFLAEGKRAAGVIALTPDNKVIVGKQFRPGPEKIMTEIPGGYVDEGEEPEAAARRELEEETGYVPEGMIPLGEFDRDSYLNGKWYYFLALNCKLVDEARVGDEDEFIDVELISIDEFIENAKASRMSDPVAVLAAYDQLRELQKETN